MYALIVALMISGSPAPVLLNAYPVFNTQEICMKAAETLAPAAADFLKKDPKYAKKKVTPYGACVMVIPSHFGDEGGPS